MTDRYTLHHSDNMVVLKTLDDNSIDSVVTDPPAGIAFMGKGWDHDKGGRDNWIAWMETIARECLRVLKPGGHALVWALPRTSHWTATAWENAGFDVRDCCYFIFGSGFPKSLDVSKQFDAMSVTDRYMHQSTHDAKQWSGWGTALKPAVECWFLLRKPLSEPTVAKNVLRWGCGALNIDACRVGTETVTVNTWDDGAKPFGGGAGHEYTGRVHSGRWPANLVHDGSPEVVAMFPQTKSGKSADGGHVRKKSCEYMSTVNYADRSRYAGELYGDSGSASRFFAACPPDEDDLATAQTIFYGTKANKRDRDDGCDELEERTNPKLCNTGYESETRIDGKPCAKQRNIHPTCKSTPLMQWLCRLITQPNGVVLDPFMGSGSTGKACMREGFRFIGIEQEAEYFEIAQCRIEHAAKQAGQSHGTRKKTTWTKPSTPTTDNQMSLFGEDAT